MSNSTKKFSNTDSLAATDPGPKPGDFPLGSAKSRAAARAVLDRRAAQERKAEKLRDSKLTPFQIAMVGDYTGSKKRVAIGLAAAAEERARIFQFDLPAPDEIRRQFAIAKEIDRMTGGDGGRLRDRDPKQWERLAEIASQNLRG